MTGSPLVLLESQRLSDAANGGGHMTDTVIPDNQANNLFLNISREDRTAGRDNLRKAFLMAQSADRTTYLGASIIITKPPSDPNVSAIVFTTDSWTDVRSDAQNAIESYLVQGPALQAWVYGNQTSGQRSILIFQRPDRSLPNVGDVLCLRDTTTTPNNIQFVRIASISSLVQTFTDGQGDYTLNVITLGLNQSLQFSFTGTEPQRFSTPHSPTLVCQTTIADAARYYSVTQPAADIVAGAFGGQLNSIFGQLVPATQDETPIVLASPQGALAIIASGPRLTETLLSGTNTAPATLYTRRSIYPGSLLLQGNGSSGLWNDQDDGKGNLLNASKVVIGTIDYEQGQITPLNVLDPSWISYDATFSASYIPAVQVSQSGFTQQAPITEATQGYVYTTVLTPLPTPGATVVSYRSLGTWYDMRDDGSGAIIAANGAGGGVVRFDSGALTVTLGALPDIGSNIIYAWGQGAQYDERTADVAIQIPAVSLTLSNAAKAGSGTPVTITWVSAGATKTAVDNGHGVFSGDATGSIAYSIGAIQLLPNSLPDPATGFNAAYTINPGSSEVIAPTRTGSDVNFTLPGAPIAPHSIAINYGLIAPSGFPNLVAGTPNITRNIVDDGAGGLIDQAYGTIAGASVNYTTGAVSFNPDLVGETSVPNYTTHNILQWNTFGGYQNVPIDELTSWTTTVATAAFVAGSNMTVVSAPASASSSAHTDSFAAPPIICDLTPTTQEPIVPGGVCFSFGGDTYVDRSGSLYRNIQAVTNSGTLAGTINYTTGQASITSWPSGGAPSLSIKALLCQFGTTPITSLSGRAPGQSIRQSSFYIQANRQSDSAAITATADTDGNWTTGDMTGHIDVDTGFFTVSFGQSVLDSSLTTEDKAQPWYNAANVDGTGHIFRPNEALAGSVKFSCVVQAYLQLNPTILGIDPVRLPIDGRVPVIRPGDTLIFRNPLTFALPNPVAASAVYSMPRTGLEDIVLYDSNGVAVDTSQYTTNPSAGTVTMASTLSLGAYTQPLIATHTQADMVLCLTTDINGSVTWNRALTNAYPAASSYVSSALVAGDIQSEYTNLFSQTTWNIYPETTWLDQFQGSVPSAAYDDLTYPIETLDRDAITMRWALVFASPPTGGSIVSETMGVVGSFTTSANVAPENPATGNPFFVMDCRGFGGGWEQGNAIRFNTVGCGLPIWFVRVTLPGATSNTDDGFSTQLRWDT